MLIFTLGNIIGKRVFALKTEEKPRRKEREVAYVLFEDRETYIEFEEQDYFTYHDCSSSARTLSVRVNGLAWENIAKYPDANMDF